MSTPKRILVVGSGPAGVYAAIEAKRKDPAADVTLLTDEDCEPYEKPPLSKAVLLGKAQPEDAPIAGTGGLAAHHVVVEPHARCTTIDRAAREVTTESGRRFPYDALVLATGSVVRELPQLPLGMPRVHYLRTHGDARALGAALGQTRELIVVGAGLIGLEVAASAAELGIKTRVVELAPRILGRVCDEVTGAFILDEHRRRGVEIRLGTAIAQVQAGSDRIAIVTADGERLGADLVVVGTGVKPDDTLAAAAGLSVDDGIVVDEQCRTSDPAIFACGDATRCPGPHGLVRLENWRHALDHGAVAGRNAAGASEAYRTTPSFWSEQYDLYIQGVGWPVPRAGQRLRRAMAGKSMLLFELDGPVLVHVLGINAQRDIGAARRLIERRIPVDAAELADPAKPLAAMLKAKA
jgi:3-phenylpropionate/trans-cinnamate dioxygenase ferredoxin reductase component